MRGQSKQEEVSAIAHTALHNVFTRIDPRYLRLKRIEEHLNTTNSLGADTYRALWRLGYWKKLVLIVDASTSLKLLATLQDIQGYWTVYKLAFPHKGPDPPTNLLDSILRLSRDSELTSY